MNKQKYFRKIQKKFSITYYYSTKLFPLKIRHKVQVLYSFLRLVDEIVDNPVSDPAITLKKLKKEFQECWNNWERKQYFELEKAASWKVIRFTEAESRFIVEEFIKLAFSENFERSWIEAFFDSMEMDLHIKRYETFEELLKYVYGSAEVVGLMMNKIMGGTDPGEGPARLLGRAMQLTNFLRDIKEDYQRGRIYIPQEDLNSFGVDEEDFVKTHSEKYLEMMRFEITRVQSQYDEVIEQAELIPLNSRLAVLTSLFVYRQVLNRISSMPEQLWTRNFKKTFWSFPRAINIARKICSTLPK